MTLTHRFFYGINSASLLRGCDLRKYIYMTKFPCIYLTQYYLQMLC